MDVDSIGGGIDFVAAAKEAILSSDALIAVIDRAWASVADVNGGRRVDDTNDFVRVELETALANAVPVVPVTVRGATMPAEMELPDTEISGTAERD